MAVILSSGCEGLGAPGSEQPVTGITAHSATAGHDVCPCYHQLYSFSGGPTDGGEPYAGLTYVGSQGLFYGTTYSGGSHGYGAVITITPSGVESELYPFSGSDGADPAATLTKLNGILYGTTKAGGTNNYGTVFSVTTSGTEAVLHSFGNGSDGTTPYAALVALNGVLYGTTAGGGGTGCGGFGCGTVFSITAGGTEKVLYAFSGNPDGEAPLAHLVVENGMLYGTTSEGGGNGEGTVFSITTSGAETVLHSFGGGGDGVYPEAGLIDYNGVLYGTTKDGGSYNDGTVFSITTSGTEGVLHSFSNGTDGAFPYAALAALKPRSSRYGTLYGTTTQGGLHGSAGGHGTVFSITTSGTETVLYSFGPSPDGQVPVQSVSIRPNGKLFGMTSQGGSAGQGTVYSLKP